MSCFSSPKPFTISHVLFLIPCIFNMPNGIILLRNLCRRRLHPSRVFPMGFLAVFFFQRAGCWPAALTPNLGDQVIFDQGFLPLAFDKPISNCKAAVLVLVRPGTHHIWWAFTHPPPGEAPEGRLATPHGWCVHQCIKTKCQHCRTFLTAHFLH